MNAPVKSPPSELFKKIEPRREDRVPQALPVKVLNDHGTGVTCDLSPSGLYFETDRDYKVGSAISMTIDLGDPPGTVLRCAGTVVRVEDRGSKVGIAVHIAAAY